MPSAAPAQTVTLAQWPAQLAALPASTALLLLGEQHDAPAHQQWEADTSAWLAARARLAALVLEMAEAGHSTEGLAPQASEAQVQQALGWSEAAWPWAHYGAAVMAAVRAGVPVYGGNLPRAQMKAVQQEAQWDHHLPAALWQRQQEAVRAGHCGLLPQTQIVPMARIQLARDASLARTAQAALHSGRTVLLLAGAQHVQRYSGIPSWLAPNLELKVAVAQVEQARAAIENEADWQVLTPALAPREHCAELRQRWAQPPRNTPAAGATPPAPAPAAAP